MKLIYKEPVIDEIQKQEEYLERNEDYDCAEAVMSAKWAVINAQEIEALPIEWLNDWKRWADSDGDVELSRSIYFILDRWHKEQEE